MTTEGKVSPRRRRGGRVTRKSGDSLFFRSLEPEGGWDGSRAAVWANQRARMLDAMARAVATKGYARVSVADVVQLAGVSRRTFYEQFRDKEDCFLVAYDRLRGADRRDARRHLEALEAQRHADHVDDVGLVVHDEDAVRLAHRGAVSARFLGIPESRLSRP
jgi:AcrR family transcriptional regulator